MKKKIICVMLSLTLCFCLACSSSFMSKTDKVYSPKNPADVEIFFTQVPKKDYQEIGLIRVDKYPPLSPIPYTNNKIRELIKASAAENGGDAVIDIKDDMLQFSGTVIVYKE